MIALLFLAVGALPPFELKNGDRVAWIGGAIAEREQKYGHWETALLCQWPDRKITFRNLAWSGDTVEGIARASFDPPAKGYERLLQSVKSLKPTVIFVSYGGNEALEGHDKLPAFEASLEKLLGDLKPNKARIVLFTPPPLEKGVNIAGIPEKNLVLAEYARAIRDAAERGGHRLADLNTLLGEHLKKSTGLTFTDNGQHFHEAGYEGTVPDLFSSLGLSWAGADPAKYEAVRKAVVKKNELYFHQWRPQNETYLFGFRKHEQGKNAKEVDEFEKLITAAESEIAKALTK